MRAPLGGAGLVLIALLLAASAAAQLPPAPAAPDSARAAPWLAAAARPDRLQHASLAFTLGLAAGLPARRDAVALGVPLGLAVAKEVRDARGRGTFDLGDLAAGALGATLAMLLVRALD